MNVCFGLLLVLLFVVGVFGVLVGVFVGSIGWVDLGNENMVVILWDIWLLWLLGVWWVGVLLGMVGVMV